MSENRIIPESFGTSGTQDANYLWGILNNCSDDYLLQIVHLFFQQINGMEAFFYYMMSKRCLVKNMLPITQLYLSSLNPVKIIPHLVDGWEDFFLESNYTLGNLNHEEIEVYRQTLFQSLSYILEHVGESYSQIKPYYRYRLRDYFLIFPHESIDDESIEEDGVDEDDDDDDGEDSADDGEGR